MKDLFDSYDRNLIHSTPGVRTDLFRRKLDEVKITDFFGNVQSVEIVGEGDVIDEDLLGKDKLASQPSSETESNENAIVAGKDILELASHGFEVTLQDNKNIWVKTGTIIACIILWMFAKQI